MESSDEAILPNPSLFVVAGSVCALGEVSIRIPSFVWLLCCLSEHAYFGKPDSSRVCIQSHGFMRGTPVVPRYCRGYAVPTSVRGVTTESVFLTNSRVQGVFG